MRIIRIILLYALDSHELPSAIGGIDLLDVSHGTDGVAIHLVKSDVAGYALEGNLPKSFVDLDGIGGTGSLQSLEGGEVTVVTHGGNSGDHIVAVVVGKAGLIGVDPLFEALIKVGGTAFLIEGGDIDLCVLALGSLGDDVGVPGIAGQQRNLDALRAGLFDDQRGGFGGNGSEEDVCVAVGGVGEIRGEVGIAIGEGIINHGAAQFLKGFFEIVAQADGIVVAQLGKAVSGLGFESIGGEVCKNGALEGIQEADAEVMGVAFGHGGVGAGDADDGDLRILKHVGSGDGHAGAIGTQSNGDALAYQAGGGGGALVVGGLVIYDNQLNIIGLAADFHGGTNIVSVLNAQGLLFTAGAVVAGSGLVDADLDNFVTRGGGGGGSGWSGGGTAAGAGAACNESHNHNACKEKRQNLFHVVPPFQGRIRPKFNGVREAETFVSPTATEKL
ncbi:hypothetical protein SDC9_65795 [bioreactor metagenome]|uniref:Uncharacterized protein n=1 Tax=bioreactor metagenome TaxID=1076179 RepID=A0A644XT18_9ZZZZ